MASPCPSVSPCATGGCRSEEPCVPVPTALPAAWQLGIQSAVFQRSLTCARHSCDISHTLLHPQRFLSHFSKHWVVSSANLHLFPLESLMLVFKKKRTGSIPDNFPHLVTVSCRNGKHKCSPLGRTGALWMTWVVAAPALVCRPRRTCPSSPVPPEQAPCERRCWRALRTSCTSCRSVCLGASLLQCSCFFWV